MHLFSNRSDEVSSKCGYVRTTKWQKMITERVTDVVTRVI